MLKKYLSEAQQHTFLTLVQVGRTLRKDDKPLKSNPFFGYPFFDVLFSVSGWRDSNTYTSFVLSAVGRPCWFHVRSLPCIFFFWSLFDVTHM